MADRGAYMVVVVETKDLLLLTAFRLSLTTDGNMFLSRIIMSSLV